MNDDNGLRLVWIDLEMTGLDADKDSILEIATIVTDPQLNILAEGPNPAISHPSETFGMLNDWCRDWHVRSGLWQRALESQVSLRQAEDMTIAFLREWVPEGASPMCGNSIQQDRAFLHRLMPRLEAYFHHRHIDVSTLKELARRWAPTVFEGVDKRLNHTALSDIRESIHELGYYRRNLSAFMG